MSQPSPRRALVVVDVQNMYFDGATLPIEYPPVAQSLPNITAAMDAARAAGIPVVVVRHMPPASASDAERQAPYWQLHPEIARRHADHTIDKPRPSVFTGTDLADWIVQRDIDTLTIVGYMTHNCDASTIYEANHRGLKVEFLADASGALSYENSAGRASAEEIHRVYSVVFHTNFAAVSSTATWIDAIATGQGLPMDSIMVSNRRARAQTAA